MVVVCPFRGVMAALVLLAGVCVAGAEPDGAAADATPASLNADRLEYLAEESVTIAIGNVELTYQDVRIRADSARFNDRTYEFEAEGDVRFAHGDVSWSGERIRGNLRAKTFDFGQYEATALPWYIRGTGAERRADGAISVAGAQASTCEHLHGGVPHWRLEADRLIYFPDGRFKAYGAVYKIGNLPVFYLPVAWGDSTAEYGGFEFRPGFKSDWGPFVRVAKEWQLSDAAAAAAAARFGVEYRAERGWALSHRTIIDTPHTFTRLQLYGMKDEDPPRELTVDGVDYNSRYEVEEERYRIWGRHQSGFLEDRLRLRINADYRSDEELLREFFRRDYRQDQQAASFVDLAYVHDRFEISLDCRPRLNDFETVVERLPELRLDVPRQPLFGLPVSYAGGSGLAHLRMNWRDYDLPRPLPPAAALADGEDYRATRFDTLHFLYLPLRLRDVSLVPRAGVRATHYSRTSLAPVTDADWYGNFRADDPKPSTENDAPVTNYDGDGGAEWRFAWELGAEVSTKFWRNWPAASRWGLDGVRHVIQPYANYTYLPEPDVDKEHLYYFDEVDRIDENHFVRFGVRQRWQTRRNRQVHTFVRLENYYDLHVEREEDRGSSGDFGTVAELAPREAVSIWGKLLVDTDEGELRVGNAGVTLGTPDGSQLRISYLYRDEFITRSTTSMGSDLTRIHGTPLFLLNHEENHNVVVNTRLPLTSKMVFTTNHYVDLDRGKLAYHSYELIRDLHCWEGGLRLVKEPEEWAVVLTLRLKAFPDVAMQTGF